MHSLQRRQPQSGWLTKYLSEEKKARSKERTKVEGKDGGVLRGAPPLPRVLLEHVLANTLAMSIAHRKYNYLIIAIAIAGAIANAIANAVAIAIVTFICFQQLFPGTADPPNCDPPPLHSRLPSEAQEACHKLPGWSQNIFFLLMKPV